MSRTMRRTPIIFDFTITGPGYNYTKDWSRIGVYWSPFNPKEMNIMPVYGFIPFRVGMTAYHYIRNDKSNNSDFFEFIESEEFYEDEDECLISLSTAFRNSKCLKEVFHESRAAIEILRELNSHQLFFDQETWMLENLSGKFQFIANIETDKIIEVRDEDDDGELDDFENGMVSLSLDLTINFHDIEDAVAYKLRWE